VFKKKVIEHKMYVFIFSTTFVSNIPHSKKTEQDITTGFNLL